jgi:predicted ATPase/transcriptional regulator with XRE-family HTH domain
VISKENGSPSTFGTVLRRFRLGAGLSQGTLAERARLGVQTIGALERGDRRAPHRDTVALLVDALDLSPDDRVQLEAAAVRPPLPRLRALNGARARVLHGVEQSRQSLPAQVSSLVGRDEMVSEVGSLLATHRMVSLVGSGGLGKTRAAVQVAENLVGDWRDGVWFVGLAPLGDSALVAGTVAAAIGMQESGNGPVLQSMVAALRRQHLLLVLDNCEHVLDAAAVVADAILRGCPHVHILATSRERLSVVGEHVYRTPSLAVPPAPATLSAGETLSANDALRYAGVALFVERARAITDFDFRDAEAPIVSEICRRLDGIPLAIELAAARVNVLDPATLLRRLDDRFLILTRGERAALPRQQTMRAAVDWSHDLLSEAERVAFRRLGIFAGGWALESAEVVCADESLVASDVFDALSSLVEKSLVLRESNEAGARYRFLETTRVYALEKLDASDDRQSAARRHAEWVAAFLERASDASLRLATSRWLPLVEREMDNARIAVEWALSAEGDDVVACRIAGNPPRRTATHDGERRRWVETALARLRDAEHPTIAARLWLTLSNLSYATHNLDAAQRACLLFEGLGDRVWLAVSLTSLVQGLICAGRLADATSAIDRALEILRELRMTRSPPFARALARQGEVFLSLGRYAEARALLVKSVALSDRLEDGYASYFARFTLAHLEFVEGNPSRTLALLQQCAEIAEREGSPFLVGLARANVADSRLALGDLDEAQVAAREALSFALRMRWPLQILGEIHTFAIIATRRGDARCAARLRSYIMERSRVEGYQLEPAFQRTDEVLVAALREHLTEQQIESLGAEGALLDEDQAADMAFAVAHTTRAAAQTMTPVPWLEDSTPVGATKSRCR